MGIKVTLVGCGRWGSKLLRALCRHPAVEVRTVVDTDPAALSRAVALAPGVRPLSDIEQALAEDLMAAVIATPSALHAQHGLQALRAGLDVFIEKPIATSVADARLLCAEARARGRVGMVGHVLRYHPAITRMIALVRDGGAGKLRRVSAFRYTNSGSPQPLWTLGPHDLSTLHAVDPSPVTELVAQSTAAAGGGVAVKLRLQSGLVATLDLSTRSPQPVRRLFALGVHRVVSIDELDPLGPLKVGRPTAGAVVFPDVVGGHMVTVEQLHRVAARYALSPVDVATADPLRRQVDHFVNCVGRRTCPLTSFEEALWVVQALDRAQASLDGAVRPTALTASLG